MNTSNTRAVIKKWLVRIFIVLASFGVLRSCTGLIKERGLQSTYEKKITQSAKKEVLERSLPDSYGRWISFTLSKRGESWIVKTAGAVVDWKISKPVNVYHSQDGQNWRGPFTDFPGIEFDPIGPTGVGYSLVNYIKFEAQLPNSVVRVKRVKKY